MKPDHYTAAVRKIAWSFDATYDHAAAALDAIGFKEIVEALEFYAELDGNEGAEPWGSRARFALARLTPPPE